MLYFELGDYLYFDLFIFIFTNTQFDFHFYVQSKFQIIIVEDSPSRYFPHLDFDLNQVFHSSLPASNDHISPISVPIFSFNPLLNFAYPS